jgi:hypothetical protein
MPNHDPPTQRHRHREPPWWFLAVAGALLAATQLGWRCGVPLPDRNRQGPDAWGDPPGLYEHINQYDVFRHLVCEAAGGRYIVKPGYPKITGGPTDLTFTWVKDHGWWCVK